MANLQEDKFVNSVGEYGIRSDGGDEADGTQSGVLGGTYHDARDMYRMGKKQELRVGCFDFHTYAVLNES
jgi:hypothetical protein